MPESAREWYERVVAAVGADGHREVAWTSWRTWPFGEDGVVRPLAEPEDEAPRGGAGGVDCFMCRMESTDDPPLLVWRDDLFMLGRPLEDPAIPVVAFLMSRRHADLADLTDAEAARMGALMMHLERAVTSVLDVPRVQVLRSGDGQEHLHWWVIARPRGFGQLRGSFLQMWNDLLPPRPRADVDADLRLVAERLAELAGGEALAR